MGDVKLGRLEFEWPLDDVSEAMGGNVEAIARRVVAGEPGARGQNLALPIRADTAEHGERLRRQVRSLLNNDRLRAEPLYLQVDSDPELDGWVIVGGGDVSEQEAGVTFGEWKLDLRDVYRVGSRRTHLPARRLEAYDRRLATTPRDYRKKLYSTDFDNMTALARHHFPYGVKYGVGAGGSTVSVGLNLAVDGRPHGDVVSFFQSAEHEGIGDVLVLDTPDVPDGDWTSFAFDDAGDGDPQAGYGWEEVYGPDFPLSAQQDDEPNHAPVLQNGWCRVRLVTNEGGLAPGDWGLKLEYNAEDVAGPTAHYVPYGVVELMRDTAQFIRGPHVVRVAEWTPERAVLALAFDDRDTMIYVTLQRGWLGPRVEAYNQSGVSTTMRFRVRSSESGAVTLGRSSGTATIAAGTSYGNFSAIEPWVYLRPQTGAAPPSLWAAVLQESVALTGRTGNSGVDFANADYLSVTFGGGATALLAAAESAADALGQTNLIESHAAPDLVSA